jgi:hypothetical protein
MRVIPARAGLWGLAVLLGLGFGTTAQAQKKDERKLKEAERLVVQALVKAADHAMATQAETGSSAWLVDASKKEGGITSAPDAVPVTWRFDMLKAQEGKIYVPFMVSFPAGALPAPNAALYVRLARRGTTAAPAIEKKGDGPYPFEDVHFSKPLPGYAQSEQMLMRAFAVPAGAYDVYLAMTAPPQDQPKRGAAPLRVLLCKQVVDVPDFWNGDLATSSIIVADKVDGLSQPLTPDQQRERPYVLGATEIVPSADRAFTPEEELTIIFQIYNPVFEEKKPDVTVEYAFFQQVEGSEKPFNRMNPQQFNAGTLPPQFDPDQGFQLAAGWSVPLKSFPAGDYRLEIKVQDNRSQKSITREVRFSVGPSRPS